MFSLNSEIFENSAEQLVITPNNAGFKPDITQNAKSVIFLKFPVKNVRYLEFGTWGRHNF